MMDNARPIIFSAPMVRALLDGRKTQTRRILKPQPELFQVERAGRLCDVGLMQCEREPWPRVWLGEGKAGVITEQEVRFAIGQRLWVREAHQFANSNDGPCVLMRSTGSRWSPEWTGPDEGAGPSFDYDRCPGDYSRWAGDVESADAPWRPSIHMPRWASRLTLVVSEVRIERLNDISEADAMAEGVETDAWDMAPVARRYGTEGWFVGWPDCVGEPSVSVEAEEVCRQSFASLWDHINGPDAWTANPWVVAVSFTMHRGNVDALDLPKPANPGAYWFSCTGQAA